MLNALNPYSVVQSSAQHARRGFKPKMDRLPVVRTDFQAAWY